MRARGEVWTLADRLAAVGGAPKRATMEVVEARELTPDAVLLVWREVAESGVILRSAVWLRSGDGWRQAFQQGTREA